MGLLGSVSAKSLVQMHTARIRADWTRIIIQSKCQILFPPTSSGQNIPWSLPPTASFILPPPTIPNTQCRLNSISASTTHRWPPRASATALRWPNSLPVWWRHALRHTCTTSGSAQGQPICLSGCTLWLWDLKILPHYAMVP